MCETHFRSLIGLELFDGLTTSFKCISFNWLTFNGCKWVNLFQKRKLFLDRNVSIVSLFVFRWGSLFSNLLNRLSFFYHAMIRRLLFAEFQIKMAHSLNFIDFLAKSFSTVLLLLYWCKFFSCNRTNTNPVNRR